MPPLRRPAALAAVVVAAAVLFTGPPVSASTPVGQPVSERYAEVGPWEVASEAAPGRAPGCQDVWPSGSDPAHAEGPPPGTRHEVFYPADTGEDGVRHPIVTFGNGSHATSREYEPLLRHLASWGFVVVVANSCDTGDGVEMLQALDEVVEQDTNPASALHGRLDVTRIAALGHSQGAGGAVNATTRAGGRITSTAVMNLPDPMWASEPADAIDTSTLAGPVLFVTGANDPVSTAGAQERYFDAVPGQAVRGRLLGTAHTWPRDGGGFRGYLTAWFAYTLRGDDEAARAFTGPAAQFLGDQAWDLRETKNLVARPAPQAPL
ncbi:alpha/beta hydrolase [Rhodococcus sp. NPDC058514]|uniref:poly(ethylene terephthalate) hydrolase family protein n=1 Tax=unclassified Rhodococcus (in: high G+C Gram-positive bacteria) TaxID=192944 RepID=UPI003647CDE6